MSRRKLLLALPFVLFAAIILASLMARRRAGEETFPVLAEVPAFTLQNQAGDAFGSSDLSGSVYVASFFFTRCRSICPVIMESVKELQGRYESGGVPVRLVSFTVDPEADDANVLGAYGEELGVDPARWTLLTCEPDKMRTLLMEGFQVPMGSVDVLGEDLIDVAHSGKLLLVDGKGRVRGHYDSEEPNLESVFNDSVRLARAR